MNEGILEFVIYLDRVLTLEKRHELLRACSSIAQKLVGQYVWHNHDFPLCTYNEDTILDAASNILTEASVNFAENIEDEWLMVYVLTMISKALPNVSISVKDADGQFLLIECAEQIPDTLHPENTSNRVFLRNGQMHIVPVFAKDEYKATMRWLGDAASLNAALAVVQRGSVCDHCVFKQDKIVCSCKQPCSNTVSTALPKVQATFHARISQYPARAVRENKHHARCFLPQGVARLLNAHPECVTRLASVLSDKDVIDTRKMRKMVAFLPSTAAMIMSRVRFTRLSYAQLSAQRLQPPNAFKILSPSSFDTTAKTHKASLLGCKLACAAEILYWQLRAKHSRKFQEDYKEAIDAKSTAVDFPEDKWEKYKAALIKREYFGVLTPDSAEYGKKLAVARNRFTSMLHKVAAKKQAALREQQAAPASKQVNSDNTRDEKLLAAMEAAVLAAERNDGWVPVDADLEDDDDSWLYLTPEHLEDLAKKSGVSNDGKSDDPMDLSGMMEKLQQFMVQESDFEGVEVPAVGPEDEMKPVQPDWNDVMSIVSMKSDTSMQFESGPDSDDEELPPVDPAMVEQMDAMDSELKREVQEEPLDINVNMVQNLLSAYSSQLGGVGPAGALLGSLGIKLPDNVDNSDPVT